ncbi:MULTISPECIES: Fis family transcriptional regulator [Limnobacter]|uniref:Putative Fis-like DNA-binding protein n=1 Tax=Limnobacter litoralis TaxID=481366 RepID=A0ABQ5YW79_9BURK|nr:MULTISPECIES: Fis family transcriptional regulator [Limnobacter]GLR27163.1 Fis family transcriptional regulator [Limnobacter litoralis]
MKPTDLDPTPITISECIKLNLDKFFEDLEGENAKSVYDMVLSAVERPMLEVVMEKANQNQTIASQMLGINRNTLRKKLQQHGLI